MVPDSYFVIRSTGKTIQGSHPFHSMPPPESPLQVSRTPSPYRQNMSRVRRRLCRRPHSWADTYWRFVIIKPNLEIGPPYWKVPQYVNNVCIYEYLRVPPFIEKSESFKQPVDTEAELLFLRYSWVKMRPFFLSGCIFVWRLLVMIKMIEIITATRIVATCAVIPTVCSRLRQKLLK